MYPKMRWVIAFFILYNLKIHKQINFRYCGTDIRRASNEPIQMGLPKAGMARFGPKPDQFFLKFIFKYIF